MKQTISFKVLMEAFIGLSSLGNSCWFIFTMLIMYVFVFVAFRCLNKHPIAAIALVLLLTVGFMFVVKQGKMEPLWYDTAFCLPLGLLYGYYKKSIDEFFKKSNWIYYPIFIACVVLYVLSSYVYRQNFDIYLGIFKNLMMAFAWTLMSMKLSFTNPILLWLGKHSFSIYLVHRIPMILIQHYDVVGLNRYVFAAMSFILALILAMLCEKLFGFYDRIFFPRRENVPSTPTPELVEQVKNETDPVAEKQ